MVFCTSLAGPTLAVRKYPSMRDEPLPPTSPETRQRCPQLWFDPILATAVRDTHVVRSLYETELLSYRQDAKRIVAELKDLRTGERITAIARYLIACDGAGSGVRKAAGIEMLGDAVLSYSSGIYLTSPGFLGRHDKGPAERYLFVGPEGVWGNLTVIDGDRYWRLTVIGSQTKAEGADFDAAAWVRRCFGRDDIPFQIDSVLPWRRGRLVAGRYSQEHVFLAGDAAHVMSPTGAFGMNTGIGDAADLGWKLEGALRGWAGEGLLDSYDAERRPVGWRNVNAAADNFARLMSGLDYSGVMDEAPRGDAARREIGRQLDEATRPEWEVLGVNLGYRYEGSPVCIPDGTPPTPDEPTEYIPTSRPGHRAPHAWLADGRSTLDLFGRGFVLLRFGNADPAPLVDAARRRDVPLTTTHIHDPAIAALYERAYVLVRPDGHVAWRGNELPRTPLAILDRVRGAQGYAEEQATHEI
jgi:2-polyprenyl-6-methoxyphenol hydroxylase-like FAD-dependent oxidoreductase